MRQWLLALLLAPLLGAQEPATATAVTEPGRTMVRPLELFFAGRGAPGDRTLFVLLDPTADLAKAGFADAFDEALAKSTAALANVRLGLAVVGQKNTVAVPPSRDFAKVAAEIRARLAKPTGEFQCVYDDLRAAAGALGGITGERELLLASLENGDVEDDLEQTVQTLTRGHVRVSVLTSEVTLADSYWAARGWQERPRGCTLTGGDEAVIDVPWGWLFQVTTANEVTPSFFASYGLNRVAAATGGRVCLYAGANQTGHQCGIYSECLFCEGDHQPTDQDYREALVRTFAPHTGSRQEVLAVLAKDAWFRTLLQAWQKGADAGLIRSRPTVHVQGGMAALERQRDGRALDLFGTTNFGRHAKAAEQAAQACDDLGNWLQAEIARLGTEKGTPRTEASVQFTRVLLQLTKVNLVTFQGWCRDIAPGLLAKNPVPPLPPEVLDTEAGPPAVGIGITNLSLCHGVRPFFDFDLPGGAALRTELEKLDAMFAQFMVRYGHSQFGYALHRQGIARFHLTWPGVVAKVPRVRPKSESTPAVTVSPSRPARAGPAAGPSASGPVTGGR